MVVVVGVVVIVFVVVGVVQLALCSVIGAV